MSKQKTKHKNSICINYTKEEVKSFKKIIKKELYPDLNTSKNIAKNSQNSSIEGINDKDHDYFLSYTRHVHHAFNSNIVNMIIVYINNNNSFPKKYKNEPNFDSKIINLFKELFINEIEVAYFTIILEKIGYNYKNLEHWLYFTLLGIATKKLCGKENHSLLIINKLSITYPRIIEEHSNFIRDNKVLSQISLKQINQRFILLSKPINTFCKKNYINIQGIIDEIVKQS